jgi:hypothetical protein
MLRTCTSTCGSAGARSRRHRSTSTSCRGATGHSAPHRRGGGASRALSAGPSNCLTAPLRAQRQVECSPSAFRGPRRHVEAGPDDGDQALIWGGAEGIRTADPLHAVAVLASHRSPSTDLRVELDCTSPTSCTSSTFEIALRPHTWPDGCTQCRRERSDLVLPVAGLSFIWLLRGVRHRPAGRGAGARRRVPASPVDGRSELSARRDVDSAAVRTHAVPGGRRPAGRRAALFAGDAVVPHPGVGRTSSASSARRTGRRCWPARSCRLASLGRCSAWRSRTTYAPSPHSSSGRWRTRADGRDLERLPATLRRITGLPVRAVALPRGPPRRAPSAAAARPRPSWSCSRWWPACSPKRWGPDRSRSRCRRDRGRRTCAPRRSPRTASARCRAR